MVIKYISSKPIDINNISKYLHISEDEKKYTNDGPIKKKLEKKLEALLELENNKCVVCVSNGTTALQLIMFLCKKNGYNKWAIPAYTFPSAIVGNIFDVDILDISKKTYTLEFDTIKGYNGIIITNLFGTYHKPDYLASFCRTFDIKLVFDNAASQLSKYKGINICNFGDYCIGSLHHTKYLGYGEGGFIVCDKNEYDIINSLSNFGYPDYLENRQYAANSKMSDISAAFILERINSFNLEKYTEIQNKLIDGIGKENVFNYSDGVIYNSFPILFKNTIDIEYFTNENIMANKYYKPLIETAKNSKYIYDRIINLPLHEDLSNKEIKKMIKICKRLL